MLSSTWDREVAVLERVGDAEEQDAAGQLMPSDIGEQTGYSPAEVRRSLERLHACGFVDLQLSPHGGGGPDQGLRIQRLTERGLRVTGLWPAFEGDEADHVVPVDRQSRPAAVRNGHHGNGHNGDRKPLVAS